MKVLVIMANGFHAGYLGAYGNDWVGTPALDRLSAEGVVFDQHYADCPEAEAARRAWRTGRHPFPAEPGRRAAAAGADGSLIELIQAAGVQTALVCERKVPDGPFAEDWDTIELVKAPAGEPLGESMVEAIANVMEELKESPHWLLWAEFNALVPPWSFPDDFFDPLPASNDEEEEEGADKEKMGPCYDPPAGPLGDDADDAQFRRLQETYAAAVRYLDACIGQLLEHIDEEEKAEDLYIIVTTDRGVALGEHGMVGDFRPWLHEELVHLPLIVRGPTAMPGRRVAQLTQPIDLLPTLLDLSGVAIPENVHGGTLVPMLRGEDVHVRDYACSALEKGMAIEYSLRTRDWAFLLPVQAEIDDEVRPRQLYARPEDRWELNNVRQHHLELSEHFEEVLNDYVKASRQPGPLTVPKLRDIETELSAESKEQT
jgi:arylsulfatase A-like enzyme